MSLGQSIFPVKDSVHQTCNDMVEFTEDRKDLVILVVLAEAADRTAGKVVRESVFVETLIDVDLPGIGIFRVLISKGFIFPDGFFPRT